MVKELVDLIARQVDKLVALLTLHVVAVAMLAVLCSDVLVTCRRLLVDDVLIYKAVSSQAVKTPSSQGGNKGSIPFRVIVPKLDNVDKGLVNEKPNSY